MTRFIHGSSEVARTWHAIQVEGKELPEVIYILVQRYFGSDRHNYDESLPGPVVLNPAKYYLLTTLHRFISSAFLVST